MRAPTLLSKSEFIERASNRSRRRYKITFRRTRFDEWIKQGLVFAGDRQQPVGRRQTYRYGYRHYRRVLQIVRLYAEGIKDRDQILLRLAHVDSAISKLENEIGQLKRNSPQTVSQLMGLEGRVGYAYFNAWYACPIKWEGTDRHPIPEDWRQIGRRSSKLGSLSHPNRFATHPINAMLNYAYGVLESQVRMQVVSTGLDPRIGILHGNARGQHGLVFDLMEPLRPIVDRKILEFVQSRTFHPADFTLANNGNCRLNPELARNVVRAVAAAKNNALAQPNLEY